MRKLFENIKFILKMSIYHSYMAVIISIIFYLTVGEFDIIRAIIIHVLTISFFCYAFASPFINLYIEVDEQKKNKFNKIKELR